MFSFAAVFFALVLSSFAVETEEDVYVLTESNFDEFIADHQFVLVEFYAPWCGHCKKLAPEYAKAAGALKEAGETAVLAKVDATVESALAGKYEVRGYPTLKFFRNGAVSDYEGGRTEKEIVNWVVKKSGPVSKVLASVEDAAAFLKETGTRILGYVSGDNEKSFTDAASSSLVDAFSFAHFNDAATYGDVAEGTIQLKNSQGETINFEGELTADSLLQWVLSEGFPLVDELAQPAWMRAVSSKQHLVAIFHKEDDTTTPEFLASVAKEFKGKVVFTSTTQTDIAARWGASGNVFPTAIVVVNEGDEQQPSFIVWDEDSDVSFDAEGLKSFVSGALDGTYKTYVKSEPIPESNDGPVTVVVGKNFDDVVLQKKNVFVEFYAPWCGHCKKLAPVYEELGEAYASDEELIVAKCDATANTITEAQIQGFPTLIFWNSENKQVAYDGERTLEAMKEFLEKERTAVDKTEL